MSPRSSLSILCFLFFASVGASTASADLVVTMNGTIETGTLNGESINGEAFSLVAEISSGIDLDITDRVGVFALSNAVMQIGESRQFFFDSTSTYFGQQFYPANQSYPGEFTVGFIDQPTTIMTQYNQFGYQRFTEEPGVDANIIQPLSNTEFDFSFASGISSETAEFSNGADELRLTDLSLAGSSISVVPEPSSFGLLGLASLVLVGAKLARRQSK